MSTLSTTNLKNPSSGSNNIVLGADGATTLGTTKVTAIADSAGSNTSTPAAIANGTAKAWVNFNGTGTVAIRASYNVSSITDNGVGDYTVNFTTAMADANYVMTQSVRGTTDGGYPATAKEATSTAKTASLIRILTQGEVSSFTFLDSPVVCIAIFR